MNLWTFLGLVAVAGAVYYSVRMWLLDQRMQRFRQPGRSGLVYAFVPVRWNDELYTPEGRLLVAEAWRAWRRQIALGLLAIALLLAGAG